VTAEVRRRVGWTVCRPPFVLESLRPPGPQCCGTVGRERLEGKARAGVQEGVVHGVEVIHARGAGDDALAAVTEGASEPVFLVSADRGLRARVERLRARVVGPSWLWDRPDP
jgi:hypothetical protein